MTADGGGGGQGELAAARGALCWGGTVGRAHLMGESLGLSRRNLAYTGRVNHRGLRRAQGTVFNILR